MDPFDRKWVSVAGIGAFVFAPMCKFLIDEYGWQGAQWIVSAIVLNGLVLGAVYRPLTFDDLERVRQKWRRKQLKHAQKHSEPNAQAQEKTNRSDDDDSSMNSRENTDEISEAQTDEMAVMLPRVHQLQNGSDRFPNLRMRTVSVSNISLDRSEGHFGSMRTIGDSCHSLTWYASSLEKLHPSANREPGTAPERSGLSLYSMSSQRVGHSK